MSTYILKIGTFITPDSDASSIGLLTQEPKNFASFLTKAFNEDIVFCSNVNATCEQYNVIDYDEVSYAADFIDITRQNYIHIFSKIQPTDKLIIWQGMKPGKETDSSMYHAYRFINAWQQLELDNMYFVMTDTRVQFLDLHAYLKKTQNDDYPELIVDSSKITMLTQAANLDVFKNKLSILDFNINVEYNRLQYFNKFKDIKHIKLHYLPLFSHAVQKPIEHKKYTNVFMTQCINYLDDYRLQALYELMCVPNKHCRNAHIFSKPVEFNKLFELANSHGITWNKPTFHDPVHFTQTKNILAQSKYSICVAEKDYVDCDLLPNRIFEAIAAKCMPVIHDKITMNTACDLLKTSALSNVDDYYVLIALGLKQLRNSIDYCINN